MAIQIPLKQYNDQICNITLNNQSCTIRVFQRSSRLYVDLYVSDNVIILGSKGVLDNGLTRSAPLVWQPSIFVGQLYFYTPQYTPLDDYLKLGKSIFLWYNETTL
jgi:hypothetical protein